MLEDATFEPASQLASGLLLLGIDLREHDRDWMLKQSNAGVTKEDVARIEVAVTQRLAALNTKDFSKADAIRAALLAEGIQLMDGKNDAGERTTKWERVR